MLYRLLLYLVNFEVSLLDLIGHEALSSIKINHNNHVVFE